MMNYNYLQNINRLQRNYIKKEGNNIIDNNNKIYEILSPKISAANNKVRFSILQLLSTIENNKSQLNNYKQDPLYSREINELLSKKFNINITPQMLGQHLKQLEKANLIQELRVKKEVPNKIGPRTVKAYKIKNDAMKDLFLDFNFFTNELLCLFKSYEMHKKYIEDNYCILTLLNGINRYKTYKINKDEIILIGRELNFTDKHLSSFTIMLDNSYSKVSAITQPHLRIFYNDNHWCILDECSTNGTFIGDKHVKKGKITQLRNNSFLRLSRGDGSAVFFCSC